MKKLQVLSIAFILICYSAKSQSKADFERNGITINFVTTQLGEISNNQFELIRDMNVAGVFIFIPDKKSIVIRHNNGNDELLEVVETKRTLEGNYIFSCNKNRVLFISTENKVITYTVEGNSSLFVFPIDQIDLSKLKNVIIRF